MKMAWNVGFILLHASAVRGLEKIIAGQSKVLSVNGYTGAVIITKADLGLENALTELPYATEETDGIITAEMFQRLSNGEEACTFFQSLPQMNWAE